MPEPFPCPLCRCPTERVMNQGFGKFIECPNCGGYSITRYAEINAMHMQPNELARASHLVWKNQSDDRDVQVTQDSLQAVINSSLPTPMEQIENFILYIGDMQNGSPGTRIQAPPTELRAKLGALQTEDVKYCERQARELNHISGQVLGGQVGGSLTITGWELYHTLKRGQTHSRVAFMAMPYGDPEVKAIVDDVFRTAVLQTEFKLERLDDNPKAGLIDNAMIVQIRNAKFLICDLSTKNAGAYWEAGYAEGLGKHVIYTCRNSDFEHPQFKPHFDVNHRQIVRWATDEPDQAAKELKATIRATFPFEAKMED
jgi:hypothetical protein